MKLAIYLVLISLIVPNLSFAGENTKSNSIFEPITSENRVEVMANQSALVMGDEIAAASGLALMIASLLEKTANKIPKKSKFLGGFAIACFALLDGAIRATLMNDDLDPNFSPILVGGKGIFNKLSSSVKLTDKSTSDTEAPAEIKSISGSIE